MSAYIVSKKIIDALVTIAEIGPKDGRGWTNAVQYAHCDGIFAANLQYPTGDTVGAALWAANVRSVNYRYSERNPRAMQAAKTYTYEPVRNVPTTLEALNLIATYEYQSCESPKWRTSAEQQFMDRLRCSLIRQLPGYDEAHWSEQG